MPLATEVHSFQREISSDKGFMIGWDAQHGTVIANAGDNAAPFFCLAADTGNQRFFCEWQGKSTISEKGSYNVDECWPIA